MPLFLSVSEAVTKKLLCAFVLSTLLPKISSFKTLKLKGPDQCCHSVRLILQTPRSAYITPLLHCLHWLSVKQRI